MHDWMSKTKKRKVMFWKKELKKGKINKIPMRNKNIMIYYETWCI